MSDDLFDGFGDEHSDRILARMIQDRKEMGTLEEDPITDGDLWFCDYLGLITRFKNGEEISPKERDFLANSLLGSSMNLYRFLTEKHKRKEASRRGGLAGKTHDPEKVMKVWRRHYSKLGKKGWADQFTAGDSSINAHVDTVKKIRLKALDRK